MARFASSLLLVIALALVGSQSPLPADPPAANDRPSRTRWSLQQAMHEAKYYLQHGNDSRKAVDLLEAPAAQGQRQRRVTCVFCVTPIARASRTFTWAASRPRRRFSWSGSAFWSPALPPISRCGPNPKRPRSSSRPSMRGTETGKRLPRFWQIVQGAAKTAEAPAKPNVVRGVPAKIPSTPGTNAKCCRLSGGERTRARQLVSKAER